jgi:hypothetical protein
MRTLVVQEQAAGPFRYPQRPVIHVLFQGSAASRSTSKGRSPDA